MNSAQRKFGEPKESTAKKVQPFLNAMVQDFFRAAPFAVRATANDEGDCDASPKGGHPGFVKVLDEKRLVLPDIAGNKLFQSYENIERNPNAGLVFPSRERRRRGWAVGAYVRTGLPMSILVGDARSARERTRGSPGLARSELAW